MLCATKKGSNMAHFNSEMPYEEIHSYFIHVKMWGMHTIEHSFISLWMYKQVWLYPSILHPNDSKEYIMACFHCSFLFKVYLGARTKLVDGDPPHWLLRQSEGYEYNLFSQSPIVGHLSCAWSCAISNNAAMNSLLCTLFHKRASISIG